MLLKDKKILILGLANHRSIAWGVAKACHEQGAKLCITYQNERLKANAEKVTADMDALLLPCDITDEGSVPQLMETLKKEWGTIDGMVHSIAFALRDDLKHPFVETSRDGFLLAHEISAYSLPLLANHARPLMRDNGGSIICMSYLGGERVMDSYRVMGVAKASLEMSARYLASDLGPEGIRVNILSPGPIKTLAAAGVAGFGAILDHIKEHAPLRRNVTQDEVGNIAAFMLSDMSRAVTGETIHVDSGYHVMGI